MTGGVAVILGPVGGNFGAGMTGGMAFVYDPEDVFASHCNREQITWGRVATAHWDGVLRDLLSQHVSETDSAYAKRILGNWDLECPNFWQVVPKDMLDNLEAPLTDEEGLPEPAWGPGAAD